MAKVFLRVYNHEIEDMIEGGQLDEAVAHCQYILKTFPMHIETYRLLGKAFLEARRYTDAADIFQRALMAVPDDFVAHVGMSIIRDDEGKLDDAIWHMERAFEVQPSNPAIQGELRRLYGRRDGIEPPKIRLSRDALANMYSQGELFNQAIAEIRSVLAEDPNRPDLQVMLARAYYRSGQKVEAAEMAAALLKKYPYCMDALRILVDVLPGTARAENTQAYRQRLHMLDPYSSFATDSVLASDQVADSAVNLERLEYKAGATPGAPQPDWASSLGIKLAGEKRAEPLPDWMKTAEAAETTEQPPSLPPEPSGLTSAPAAAGDSVPDWMRSAGWQESTGAAQAGPADSGEEPPAEPIAHADIPDWLKSMAPPEMTGAANAEPESVPVSEAPSTDSELESASMEASSTEAKTEPAPAATSSTGAGALPDWLRDLGAGAAAEAAAVPEQSQAEEQLVAPEQSQAEEQAVMPEPPAQEPTKSLVSAPGSEGEPSQPKGQVKPLEIGDDALGWLESLAVKQGAKPEELLTTPQERSEEMPEWLRQSSEQPPVPSTQEPVTTPRETLPLEPLTPLVEKPVLMPPSVTDEAVPVAEEILPIQPPAEEETQPVNVEDDTLAWLERLAADQGAKPEEQPAAPAPVPESVSEGEDVTITSWLNKLDVEEAAGKAPPASTGDEQPTTPPGELPDWLKDLEKPVAQAESPKADEDLPEWLRQPAAPPASEPVAETPAPELTPGLEAPAWIDENAPVSAQAAPTAPEEWVPAEKPAVGPEIAPAAEASAAAVQLPILKGTGMLARVPAQDKNAELLSGAQAALEGNSLGDAMKEYGKLIKKGRLLDEVIHDLREAIYRFPVDVIVWQTLGDAYMRANRLQDALDAYTKAEELLR